MFRSNSTSSAPLWAFFVSGAAGLVYQVVWARLLGRLVGSDALGIALTLTVFMLGLGLGAPLVARVAGESVRPLRLWAALVGGIALWALASPWALTALEPVAAAPLRLLLATAFLLPPTLAMGGTVPAMARVVAGAEPRAGQRTARFYAANTWGAACGALAGSFVLLPALGLSRTLIVAALAEAAVALWAWRMAPAGVQPGPRPRAPSAQADRPERSAGLARLALASGLLGTAGLCFEVLATRALTSLMGASTYAFALVLAIFLAGLASGAAWTRRRMERPAPVATWIALLPLAMTLGFALVTWRSGGANPFESAINLAPQIQSAPAQWVATALLGSLCLLPATWLLGALFPALVRRLDPEPERAQARIALLYSTNALGSAAGALTTAWALIPALGLLRTLSLPFVCSALALALLPAEPRRGRAALLWLLSLGSTLGLGVALGWTERPADQLFARAGPVSTAQVRGSPDPALPRSLLIEGKVVASTAPIDLRLQILLGALPVWLHGEVRSGFVIGLGTGMTAGALLLDPALESLEVVEISSAVVAASAWFEPWNQGLLADRRLELRLGDGRHRLRTQAQRFDLVTSDPIHPWTRGSSDLYALEHFQAMAAHLRPRGVASQWLPLYQLSEQDQKTIIATWCAAFPQVSACLSAYDLVLLGANDRPLDPVDPQTGQPWPVGALLTAALAPLGIADGCDLAALWVADDSRLRAYAEGVPPMRSDRPVLEFRAPLSFARGYSRPTLAWAAEPAEGLPLPACAQAPAARLRSLVQRFLEDSRTDWRAAAQAYGDALVLPAGR